VAKPQEAERERRCLVTGESGPADGLLRFVIAPDGAVTPDLAGKLPGRGFWVTLRRDAVDTAVKKKLFQAAAARAGITGPVTADERLGQQVGDLLTKNALGLLGLAKRAGLVSTGFEKAKAVLAERSDALLVFAADGSLDGRRKLVRRDRQVVDLFDREQLSLALGRENVVHAALVPEGVGARFVAVSRRLAAYQAAKPSEQTTATGRKRAAGGHKPRRPSALKASRNE